MDSTEITRFTPSFAEVLIRNRQCRVEITWPSVGHVIPPSNCRRESYLISVSKVVHLKHQSKFMLRLITEGILYALANTVPLRCQVRLFRADVAIRKDPGFYTIRAQARLHTDMWAKLCEEFPFLTVEEVIQLSLLPPEKRRLCILGRKVK